MRASLYGNRERANKLSRGVLPEGSIWRKGRRAAAWLPENRPL